MADEAKKPENDKDDYYGPEHGYVFRLGLFKRRIPPKFRERIKQKLNSKGDEPLLGSNSSSGSHGGIQRA
jgi:hypothetical protein